MHSSYMHTCMYTCMHSMLLCGMLARVCVSELLRTIIQYYALVILYEYLWTGVYVCVCIHPNIYTHRCYIPLYGITFWSYCMYTHRQVSIYVCAYVQIYTLKDVTNRYTVSCFGHIVCILIDRCLYVCVYIHTCAHAHTQMLCTDIRIGCFGHTKCIRMQ